MSLTHVSFVSANRQTTNLVLPKHHFCIQLFRYQSKSIHKYALIFQCLKFFFTILVKQLALCTNAIMKYSYCSVRLFQMCLIFPKLMLYTFNQMPWVFVTYKGIFVYPLIFKMFIWFTSLKVFCVMIGISSEILLHSPEIIYNFAVSVKPKFDKYINSF